MHLISDTFNLYKREMIVFKANLLSNIIRSIIFPLVLIVFLGGLGNTISHIPIAIVNYAHNPKSFQFISKLQSNNILSIKYITTQKLAMNMLHSSNVSIVIIIPPNFFVSGHLPIQIYYNNNDFQNSGTAIAFIQSTANKYNNKSHQTPISSTALSGTKANYKDFLFAGILIMVAMMGSSFNGGMSLIRDRDSGVLKSLLMSPISKLSIILSKVLSGITQSTLYVLIAIVIALADGVVIAMVPFYIAILYILFFIILISIVFSFLAILLATRISKVEIYMMIMNAITLPLWFLSGAFFPTSSLPKFFKLFNKFNPLTYAVNPIKNITMLGYLTPHQIILNSGFIFIAIIITFIFAYKLFKTTID